MIIEIKHECGIIKLEVLKRTIKNDLPVQSISYQNRSIRMPGTAEMEEELVLLVKDYDKSLITEWASFIFDPRRYSYRQSFRMVDDFTVHTINDVLMKSVNIDGNVVTIKFEKNDDWKQSPKLPIELVAERYNNNEH